MRLLFEQPRDPAKIIRSRRFQQYRRASRSNHAVAEGRGFSSNVLSFVFFSMALMWYKPFFFSPQPVFVLSVLFVATRKKKAFFGLGELCGCSCLGGLRYPREEALSFDSLRLEIKRGLARASLGDTAQPIPKRKCPILRRSAKPESGVTRPCLCQAGGVWRFCLVLPRRAFFERGTEKLVPPTASLLGQREPLLILI